MSTFTYLRLRFAYFLARACLRFLIAYCGDMDKKVGTTRGQLDVLCTLLSEFMGWNGVSIVAKREGNWCNCGKLPRHREDVIGLNSFGMTDQDLAEAFQMLSAGLSSMVARGPHPSQGVSSKRKAPSQAMKLDA